MDHVRSCEQLKHMAPYKIFYLIIHIKSPVGIIRFAEMFCINA